MTYPKLTLIDLRVDREDPERPRIGTRFVLRNHRFQIGHGAMGTDDVSLWIRGIGPVHAWLEQRTDGWYLKAVWLCETRVNGESVDEVKLSDGDIIDVIASRRRKLLDHGATFEFRSS